MGTNTWFQESQPLRNAPVSTFTEIMLYLPDTLTKYRRPRRPGWRTKSGESWRKYSACREGPPPADNSTPSFKSLLITPCHHQAGYPLPDTLISGSTMLRKATIARDKAHSPMPLCQIMRHAIFQNMAGWIVEEGGRPARERQRIIS